LTTESGVIVGTNECAGLRTCTLDLDLTSEQIRKVALTNELTRVSRSRVLCLTMNGSSERKHVGDAWAHRGDEGRGKLRKARGSGTHALIPRWPNGATRPSVRTVIWLSSQRRTLGTETSQYRQEEKSTEIPQVAASERGRAQTGFLVEPGL
jgi:hypothetical protein